MNNETRRQLREDVESLQAQIEELNRICEGLGAELLDPAACVTPIQAVIDELATLRDSVTDFQEEEQSKFDNLSEGLQNSEKGEALQAAADALESAASNIDGAISNMPDVGDETTVEDLVDELRTVVDDYIDCAISDINEAIG